MSEDEETTPEIDWNSAEVRRGKLTVGLTAKPPKEWRDRLGEVLELLDSHGANVVEVKVVKQQLRVAEVAPGSEGDVRHVLESAVMQVNADLAPDEDEDEDGGELSERDQEMTDAFRAFGDGDGDG